MKRTQCGDILWHLTHKGGISSAQAFDEYGITRLSARIFDLRDAGIDIENVQRTCTDRRGKKCTYTEYRLAKKE